MHDAVYSASRFASGRRKRGWEDDADTGIISQRRAAPGPTSSPGLCAASSGFDLDPRLLKLQSELLRAEELREQKERELQELTAQMAQQAAKRKRLEEASAINGVESGRIAGYKTQLCKFFPVNQCTKGAACTYAHGEQELESYMRGGGSTGTSAFAGVDSNLINMAVQEEVAKLKAVTADESLGWSEASQVSEEGEPKVRGYKTQLCKFFPLGTCTKADSCTYAHGEEELVSYGTQRMASTSAADNDSSSANAGATMRSYKTQPCKYFPLGRCTKGDECSYIHEEVAKQQDAPNVHPAAAAISAANTYGVVPGAWAWMAAAAGGSAVQQPTGMMALGAGQSWSRATIQPASPSPQNGWQLPAAKVNGSGDAYKYKTEMCKFHLVGRCTKGEHCTYAHHEYEIYSGPTSGGSVSSSPRQPSIPVVAPIRPVNMALPVGQVVPPRRFKTQQCKFFLEGTCLKGNACTFVHDDSHSADEFAQQQQQQQQRRQQHQEELELQDPNSLNLVKAYKTQMCKFFPLGACNKGDACTYAHAEEEMRQYGPLDVEDLLPIGNDEEITDMLAAAAAAAGGDPSHLDNEA